MLRTFYRSSTGNVTVDLPATEWRTALQDQTGVLWVDFNAEPLAMVEPPLRHTFGFHAGSFSFRHRRLLSDSLPLRWAARWTHFFV